MLLWSDHKPQRRVIPLEQGQLELGRAELAGLGVHDDWVSRKHVGVGWDGARWSITDRGSKNGCWLDGARVLGSTTSERPRVLRIGRSLLGFTLDAAGRRESYWSAQGEIIGSPPLWAVWDRVAKASQFGDTLLITGETGSGKELAARIFHERGPAAHGPFVTLNCAAVPQGLAESLLFGALKGAYSGAHRDSDGYLLAAHEGTLFLDEIAELEPSLQAKLLRVIETREVFPLGATRPRKVDIRICSASHVDLASRLGSSFRRDLFFRIGTPRVMLPPLRERLEEIPQHIVAEVSRWSGDLRVSSSLVESCLLRVWLGNVRELKLEVRALVQEAILNESAVVGPPSNADEVEAPVSAVHPERPAHNQPADGPMKPSDDPYRQVLLDALRKSEGNVAEAARRLKMHRTQLRRELIRYGLEWAAVRPGAATGEEG